MADNENINFTTDIIDTEIYEQDVSIIDETKDVVVETEIKTIEVFETDVGMVESDSAFSPIGEANELLRHTLLTERDVSDQHPITAITGLRDELDGIKALKTVYADKRGIANYYKWNNGAYNEYGYFVSLVLHTSEIKICDGADIFGVTVDAAGFIGGQDESVPRDNTYALVVTSGLVGVRCEFAVAEGDYVVSNAYGIAEKTDSGCGYKVVTIENKNGTNYALISLGVQACTTDMLGQQIQHLDGRMDDAESNIVAAMNVANAAYNKAGEAGTVSEEAIKNALEALDKANGASEKTDGFEERLSTSNALAEEAKNIALLATTTAAGIANAAVETSNKTLANVNNLIADLEPITTWSDPETGNAGAEYFTTYVKDGVATKAEIQTVETLTNDNKSAIEKSAEEFSSLVSSVDKYSVGEYSQAYGLTHEQAKSILKVGMIYIPANNSKGTTHVEAYEGQGQDNYFTEGRYYEWDGDDWQEHTVGKVWISNAIPANSNGAYKYWYVDSNEGPEGYEAHALYKYDGEQWKKVNILDGNVNNRLTSMIRQTADEVSAEVVNARGSAATLGVRITNTESEVQSLALWSKGGNEDSEQYNLATIKQTADDAGASVAQVVESVGKDGKVTAASIVTSINNDTTGVTIEADHINLRGAVTIESLDDNTRGKLNNSVQSTVIEYALSSSATVAPTSGWSTTAPQWQENQYMWQKTTIQYTDSSKTPTITTTCIQGAKGEDGKTPEIEINDNGYWVIDGTTTNTKAEGVDGETPTVVINTDGYWVINGVATDIKAQGKDGDNGVSVISVVSQYCLSISNTIEPTNGWTENFDTVLSQYWGSTETVKYIWSREKVSYSSGNPTYSTATVNSASSVVASWCDKNDTTKINGGNIATNTVTADQIYVQDLSAFGATIGGWDIDINGIHKDVVVTRNGVTKKEYEIDLWTPSNSPDQSQQWIFMFTDNTGTQPTYPFVVKKDGTLIANKATIAGDSNIGGWTISGTAGLIKENEQFKVHIKPPTAYDGPGVAAADFIVLTDKTGDKDTYPFVVSSDGTVKATKAIITGDSIIEGNCTIKGRLDGAGLVSLNNTANGYNTLINFNTYDNVDGSYGNMTMMLYYDGWKENSETDTVGYRGRISITGDTVSSGPRINLSSYYITIDAIQYDTGNASTYSETDTIGTSDQNLKNTITSISSSYSTLFDSLRPVTFKFNNGTSNRLHTGFIAQEVDEAISVAGLTRQDFAGLCILNEGAEDERWGLRYGEFVALNTYEIQKLKARVAELEAKLENKEN